MAAPELTFCVVATAKRELLGGCLDAIARERETLPFATETLVLDNCSRDGSAELARAHPAVDETIELPRRTGKGANDSQLLAARDGPLRAAAQRGLRAAPGRDDRALAGAGGTPPGRARRRAPAGPRRTSPAVRVEVPLARGSAGVRARAAGPAGRPESRQRVREVDWCQSSALLVRREAAARVGYLDPDFFVYSDEVDFARRLRDAGWVSLFVPSAGAVHHEQLSNDPVGGRARIVELARNRDLYMRKHHSPATARAVRWLTAAGYAERALAALVLPGHSRRRYWLHVEATLHPSRGEGLREGAERLNASLAGELEAPAP